MAAKKNVLPVRLVTVYRDRELITFVDSNAKWLCLPVRSQSKLIFYRIISYLRLILLLCCEWQGFWLLGLGRQSPLENYHLVSLSLPRLRKWKLSLIWCAAQLHCLLIRWLSINFRFLCLAVCCVLSLYSQSVSSKQTIEERKNSSPSSFPLSQFSYSHFLVYELHLTWRDYRFSHASMILHGMLEFR